MSEVPVDTALKETRGEISLEWKIQKFSSLPNYEEFSVNSPSFLLSDAKWRLQIFPNEKFEDETVGKISLYLCLLKRCSAQKYQIAATVGIKRADGSVCTSYSFEYEYEEDQYLYGCYGLLETSSLLDSTDILTAEDTLTVFCTACLVHSPFMETISQTLLIESAETLAQNLKDLYISKRHGDFTIKVKEKEFQVHRSILAARSTVFASMVELDMAEKNSGEANIDDCDPGSFENFLIFLYTGKLEHSTSDNACSLYKTADKYDVKDLKAQCAQLICSELSIDTFCDAVVIAALYDESELLKITTDFFAKNLKAILLTPQWKEFLVEQPTLANELFITVASMYEKRS